MTTIGLDWGTSNLRAFLIGADGTLIIERRQPWGVRQLPPGGFAVALDQIAGDWLRQWPEAAVVACGMVGSREGWRDAGYLDLPADPQTLAGAGVRIGLSDGRMLHVLPGLRQGVAPNTTDATNADPHLHVEPPDVMRGEETQVVGALARQPELARSGWIALPGTHGKWVRLHEGRIVRFQTYMTGELFELLNRHSILALTLAGAADADVTEPTTAQEAFEAGVIEALSDAAALSSLLFRIRARSLLHQESASAAAGRLSGLLIGHEVHHAAATIRRDPAPTVIVGEPALTARYQRALAHAGLIASVMDNTAIQGLHRLSTLLPGLTSSPTSPPSPPSPTSPSSPTPPSPAAPLASPP